METPKTLTIEEITRRLQVLEREQQEDEALIAAAAEHGYVLPPETEPELTSPPTLPRPGMPAQQQREVPSPIPPTTPPEKNPTLETPLLEVGKFISEFNLESLLPREFEDLKKEQKLKVVRDIKKRMVDVVKSKAETQYSEEYKKKSIWKKISATIYKDRDIIKIEGKAFKELLSTDEGKTLLRDDLEILAQRTSKQTIILDRKGNPLINYGNIYNPDSPENEKRLKLITVMNDFASKPYEWGQEEKGKNKKTYDGAKSACHKALQESSRIKEREIGGEKALIETLQLRNAIELEQLLNTHPEFEKELNEFGKSPSFKKLLGKKYEKIQQVVFGKNFEKLYLTGGGAFARTLAKGAVWYSGATIISFVAAPLIGAAIGAKRGVNRAYETLEERQRSARRGKKDESAEAMNTVSAENLSIRLDAEIQTFNNIDRLRTWKFEKWGKAGEFGKENDRLDKIKRRIKYTQQKIQDGLVDFGNEETRLANQYDLLNSLNEALGIAGILEETTRKDIDAGLEIFLKKKGEKIQKAQYDFVGNQMIKGAISGFSFGIAGYSVRWAGEQLGWWGDHGTSHSIENVDDIEIKNLEEKLEELQKELKEMEKPQAFFKKTPQGAGNPFILHAEESVVEKKRKLLEQIETIRKEITERKAKLKGPSAPVGEPVKPTLKPATNPLQSGTPQTPPEVEPKVPVNSQKLPPEVVKSTPVEPVKVAPAATPNPQPPATPALKIQPVIESTPSTPSHSQISANFTLELGKNGVPKNLETVFTSISANHLNLPTDANGISINEEFATKSLNMGANLVKLTEGKDVAGITQAEWNEAGNFWDGELEIRDHEKFNAILTKLQDNADKSWKSGVLQSKGAASSYVGNISKPSWLKIIHADGLDKVGDKTTGVGGHDDIKLEQIGNFKGVEMPDIEKSPILHTDPNNYPPETDVEAIAPDTSPKVLEVAPTPKNISLEMTLEKPLIHKADIDTTFERELHVEKVRKDLVDLYDEEKDREEPVRNIDPDAWMEFEDAKMIKNNYKGFTEETVKVYAKNVNYINNNNAELPKWKTMKATELLGNKKYDRSIPVVRLLRRLQEITGLKPKGFHFFDPRSETVREYIMRTLEKATKQGKLASIKEFFADTETHEREPATVVNIPSVAEGGKSEILDIIRGQFTKEISFDKLDPDVLESLKSEAEKLAKESGNDTTRDKALEDMETLFKNPIKYYQDQLTKLERIIETDKEKYSKGNEKEAMAYLRGGLTKIIQNLQENQTSILTKK